MANRESDVLVRYVRRLADRHMSVDASDAQLLRDFLGKKDSAALDILMRRHGGMVLRVCRRVLGDIQLAEDAFQATFLILLRKGNSIRERESLAGWLYRVAYRVATRARAQRFGWRPLLWETKQAKHADPLIELCKRELASTIDEEVNRIPERCRVPILLCYLEGRTRDEAAQQLQLPLRTFQRRLEEGRTLLRARLARRGISLSSAALASGLGDTRSEAAILPALEARTRLALVTIGSNQASPVGVLSKVALALSRVNGMEIVPGAWLATVCLALAIMVPGICIFLTAFPPTIATAGAAGSKGTTNQNRLSEPDSDLTGIVRGQVVDENDRPLPSARIILQDWRDGKPRLQEKLADSDGRFEFNHLARGKIIDVLAIVDGKAMCSKLHQLNDREPAIDWILRLTPSRQLKLQFTDEQGKPIQDVELLGLEWSNNRRVSIFPEEIWTQKLLPRPKSDQNGILNIDRLETGALIKGMVRHSQFAMQEFEEDSHANGLTKIKLVRGVPTKVQVVDGTSRQPISDARVSLKCLRQSKVQLFNEYCLANTNSAGLSTVCLKPSHTYSFQAFHAGFARNIRQTEFIATTQEASITLELFPKAKIVGRCLDEDTGRPVSGVQLNSKFEGQHDCIAWSTTDKDGNYELDACAGKIAVGVQTSGYRTITELTSLDIEGGRVYRAADVFIKRLPPLTGIVKFSNGKPAPGIDVTCENWGGRAHTDELGQFALQPERMSPEGCLVARHPYQKLSGFHLLEYWDEQRQTGAGDLDIMLEPESVISGSIVDAAGKPMPNVPVWLSKVRRGKLSTQSEFMREPKFTDDQGRFRFQGMPTGCEYRAHLKEYDWNSGSEQLELSTKGIQFQPMVGKPKHPMPSNAPPSPSALKEIRCREWLNSDAQTDARLRGKITVLYFWAIWDQSSLPALRQLQHIHTLYADKGVQVMAIHHGQGNWDEIRRMAKQEQLTFPIAIDSLKGETFKAYEVDYPTTGLLYDRKGRALWRSASSWGLLTGEVRNAVLFEAEKE